MGWEYVGGCNIARGAEGDNNQNKFGQSRRSPGPSAYSRYEGSPSFFRPPESPIPYVVAMSSARAPPINSDVKLIPENHLKPLRVKKGNVGVKVRLNKEFCPEIDVMAELAKGKLPTRRLQFNSPDLFPEVREGEGEEGQYQELHYQGPPSLVNPYSSRRVHAPSVPWRYLQRSFQSPPCSRNAHGGHQQNVDHKVHRESTDSVRSTRDAQCQTICDAGVQTENRNSHGKYGYGRKSEDAPSLQTSSSNVSLVSLGIHVDVADSEEYGRGKRVSSKARVSPGPRQRKSAVGKKKEGVGRSVSTDSSRGKTWTIGKPVKNKKKTKKKKKKNKAPQRVGSNTSGEEGSPREALDLTAIYTKRPHSELPLRRESESSATTSASTGERTSSPDLHSDYGDASLNPNSISTIKSNHHKHEPQHSSNPSTRGDFLSTPHIQEIPPATFRATSNDPQDPIGVKPVGASDSISARNLAKSGPFGSSVHISSGLEGTPHKECLSSAHGMGSRQEDQPATTQSFPVGGMIPTDSIPGVSFRSESVRDVLDLSHDFDIPRCSLAPSTSTPRQACGTSIEKSVLMPFPSPARFTLQHVNHATNEKGKGQEESRNSLESLAELERLIEEQHMQLVARGILRADDDVMESSVDDLPDADAEAVDKHLNSVRKVAFGSNLELGFSDQKHSSDGTINSEFLRAQANVEADRQTTEHQAQTSQEVRDLEVELSRNLAELLDVNTGAPRISEKPPRDANTNVFTSRGLPATSSGYSHAKRQGNGIPISSFLVDDQSESDLSESLMNLLEKEPGKRLEAELGCSSDMRGALDEEGISKDEGPSTNSRNSVQDEDDDTHNCLRRECQYDCSCSYSLNEDSIDGSSHVAGMVASVAAVAMRSELEGRKFVRDPGVFNVDIIRQ
ncbi:hypothetical protein BSKO_00892 [Bryopsis sp. KO-2023]|nr:hypothetical protein BSKO_00892 [Bryopsis sp. KO-2023]